jgi:hypothetical protein
MNDTLATGSISLTPERPWPGLAAYGEVDAGFFFGRSAESIELHRLVRAEPLAVLFGISGLGKTSLVEAGLFPRLRAAGWLPVPVRLRFASDAPPLATQVLNAAAGAASEAGLTVPQWHKGDTLWQAFHRRGQLFWGAAPEPATPVIVFDQFEECFTLGEGDPTLHQRTAQFLSQLSDLVENRGLSAHNTLPRGDDAFTAEAVPLRVVLSLREDYLAVLEALRNLFSGLRRARLRLLAFTAEQAREVVERPGTHLLAPGAADAILDTFLPPRSDAMDTAADPALLSLFCWQLNEQRLAAGLEHLEADRIAGSRERIMRDFYTSAFAGLENAEAVQRWVEESLVDAGGYRSSRSWSDALAASGVTRSDLERLVKRRVLHPVDRPGAPSHLELTHDRLREVVVESRETRRTEAVNAAAAKLRRRLRRTRLALAVMAVLLALAIGAAVYAFSHSAKPEKPVRNYLGKWTNVNSETRGITTVLISEDNSGLKIEVWGKCHPTDCDWGVVPAHKIAASVDAGTFDYLFATWPFGFEDTYVSFKLSDDPEPKLLVSDIGIFKDNSKRDDYHGEEVFRKVKKKD